MKILLSVKTLLRAPLKTLLTLLLLAATSYMLFFNAAEYAVTSREFKRTKASYRGVGHVEAQAFAPKRVMPIFRNNWPSVSGTDAFLYADERVLNNYYDYDEAVPDSLRYAPIRQSDVDAISALPYVSSVSARYMTAGLSDDVGRSDLMNRALLYPKFNYTERFIAEVTVVRHVFKTAFGYYARYEGYDAQYPPLNENDWRSRGIVVDDVKILAGDSSFFHDYDQSKETVRFGPLTIDAISLYPDSGDDSVFGYFDFALRERFSSVMHFGRKYFNEVNSYEFLDILVPGEKYVVIGRVDSVAKRNGSIQGPVLSDPSTIGWWPQVYPLKGLPENYLELDEFAPLREMIEITNNDRRTFDVVYTDGMESIRRFADGSMNIADGRKLTGKDSDEHNNVCVMGRYFMQNNNLEVGDTITLRLGDKLFEQNSALGAVASVRERYADSFTDEIEFEIVGAYADIDNVSEREKSVNAPWTYSDNTIFVPMSFLPCEVPGDHTLKPGEFSFIIGDASDISAFLGEQAPVIEEEMGLTLFFNDGGWVKVEEQLDLGNGLVVFKLILFSLSTAIAICLTVYLFVMRKRKEYAVMRALGTTVRRSNRSLYVPLGFITVVALAAGYMLAYINAGNAMTGSLEVYARLGLEVDTSIPLSLTALCVFCELAALTLVTAFALYRTGAKQPLELLSGNQGTGVREQGTGAREAAMAARELLAFVQNSLIGAESPGRYATAHGANEGRFDGRITQPLPSMLRMPPLTQASKQSTTNPPRLFVSFVAMYITRHIRRSLVKSLLSAGVALLLLGTIGQLTLIRGAYRDAYDNIGALAHVSKGLKLKEAIQIAESDYVRKPAKGGGFTYLKEPYFENIIDVLECNSVMGTVVRTNDIERFCEDRAEFEFLEGYGFPIMNAIDAEESDICILAGDFMEENGIALGDTVGFTLQGLRQRVLRTLTANNGGDELTGEQWESIDDIMEESTAYYRVVGRLTIEEAKGIAFLPVAYGLEQTQKWLKSDLYKPTPSEMSSSRNTWHNQMIFRYAEYTLASRDFAAEFRPYANRAIVSSIGASRFPPLIIDTNESDSMSRTMELLDDLYPIAVAAAAVLGALFPGLVVMQSDREASIMRVLGTTKKRSRTMLISEQAILYLCGLLCAAALLLLINGVAIANYVSALLSYSGLHLAACLAGALICAVIVTKRKPLELLQVKE